MALSEQAKLSSVYKKLAGVSETDLNKQFYEESFKSGIAVMANMVWRESDKIPPVAPSLTATDTQVEGFSAKAATQGVVTYIKDLTLLPVKGSPNAFYHDLLKNAIPFNHDKDGSYLYKLKNSVGSAIAFGIENWTIDTVAGVLMFYGTPSKVGVTAEKPPKVSFYRYCGDVGLTPMNDSEELFYSAGDKTVRARFNLKGDTGLTVYNLPSVANGDLEGTVMLEENFDSVAAKGNIDGGIY